MLLPSLIRIWHFSRSLAVESFSNQQCMCSLPATSAHHQMHLSSSSSVYITSKRVEIAVFPIYQTASAICRRAAQVRHPKDRARALNLPLFGQFKFVVSHPTSHHRQWTRPNDGQSGDCSCSRPTGRCYTLSPSDSSSALLSVLPVRPP